MSVFTADAQSSKDNYFTPLNDYMEGNVLSRDEKFICKHHVRCERSCARGVNLIKGQLHHVGEHYDLKRDGKPFRIMVSGAEYGGGEEHVSLADRSGGINEGGAPTNPHMKGTMLLLQMLFGKTIDNYDYHVEVDGEQRSIFKCFALANFLLCSAVREGSKLGHPSCEMIVNCKAHFQKTIEILKPQFLILQGRRAEEFFRCEYDIELGYRRPKVQMVETNGHKTLVLPLTHPAYQRRAWGGTGHKATETYLRPAVNQLLEKYECLHG